MSKKKLMNFRRTIHRVRGKGIHILTKAAIVFILSITVLTAATIFNIPWHTACAKDGVNINRLSEQYKSALSLKTISRSLEGVTVPSLVMNLDFPVNSSSLTPRAIKYLDALGLALQDETLRTYIYRVDGHTCSLGSTEYNYNLSFQRAQAVVDYLVQNFYLPRDRFIIKGCGESKPVANNATEEGRKKNRRVVIINTLQDFQETGKPERPKVKVCAKYVRSGEEKELTQGETLNSKDTYCVEFSPQTAAHIYLYQISGGKKDLLFPNEKYSKNENPVIPGRIYRVPDFGRGFYLNHQKGEEQLVLIAQKEELKDPMDFCQKAAALGTTNLKKGLSRSMQSIREALEETVPPAPLKMAGKPDDLQENSYNALNGIFNEEEAFIWKLSFQHQ